MPLPKIKDPIITELKRICETQLAIPVTFMEANRSEANLGLDALKSDQFPALIYITTTSNDNEVLEAGEVMRRAQTYLMLLADSQKATLDYNSSEVNDIVYQMYQLGQNLIYWINKSPYSVHGGVDKWKSDNLYDQFDSQLIGQGLTIEWRLFTGKTGYYNNPGIV